MTHNEANQPLLRKVNHTIIEEPFFVQLGVVEGKHILDIGCGDGRYSRKMCELGANVTGIDTNKERIEAAEQYSDGQLRFSVADATSYIPELPVDIVTAMMMVNELPKDLFEHVLANVSRWLPAGGRFVFILPHPFNFYEHTVITDREGLTRADYFNDGKPFITTYQDNGMEVTVTDHHYSLGYLTQKLHELGFGITNIIEPRLESLDEINYHYYPFYLIVDAHKQ